MTATQRKISWIFDVVSPFAYLALKQFSKLPKNVEIEFVPILFAAVLNHHGQKGPAELTSKRKFTYRFVLWRASTLGIDMRLPPAHPFNPLSALRLIIAAGSRREAVESVFDAIFRDGRDVSDPQVIADLGARMGLSDPLAACSAPEVKQKLHDNTAWALSRDVFGVPTFAIDNELFWGQDAFDMALDYLQHPEHFQSPQMQAIDSLPVGASRR